MKVLIAFNNNPIMATENYLINIQINYLVTTSQ